MHTATDMETTRVGKWKGVGVDTGVGVGAIADVGGGTEGTDGTTVFGGMRGEGAPNIFWSSVSTKADTTEASSDRFSPLSFRDFPCKWNIYVIKVEINNKEMNLDIASIVCLMLPRNILCSSGMSLLDKVLL